MRRTLFLAKPAAKAMEAAASDELRPLSKVVGGVLAKFRGTIMEAMAKGMSERDRVFLAQRWGFSGAVAGGGEHGEIDPALEKTSQGGDTTIEAAHTVINAEEKVLVGARIAGYAARRALEISEPVEPPGNSFKMSGHDQHPAAIKAVATTNAEIIPSANPARIEAMPVKFVVICARLIHIIQCRDGISAWQTHIIFE